MYVCVCVCVCSGVLFWSLKKNHQKWILGSEVMNEVIEMMHKFPEPINLVLNRCKILIHVQWYCNLVVYKAIIGVCTWLIEALHQPRLMLLLSW